MRLASGRASRIAGGDYREDVALAGVGAELAKVTDWGIWGLLEASAPRVSVLLSVVRKVLHWLGGNDLLTLASLYGKLAS